MRTYNFAEKNSSCTMTVSADNEEEAINEMSRHVKYPLNWRLDDAEGWSEDDGEDEDE